MKWWRATLRGDKSVFLQESQVTAARASLVAASDVVWEDVDGC